MAHRPKCCAVRCFPLVISLHSMGFTGPTYKAGMGRGKDMEGLGWSWGRGRE
jgi:hypothetical protein